MNLIVPGRAAYLPVPCGTNGLATCVGLAVATPDPNEWFVAHVDCSAQVRKVGDPCYVGVATWVREKVEELAPGGSETIYIVKFGSGEVSLLAIADGLGQAYPEATPVELSGFVIQPGGEVQPLGGEANNDPGQFDFSVPPLNAPGQPCAYG